ncbi:Uncharacterised protein [Nocardia africana]|uniref:Histidine kinase-, DNA gyrase B-, and HSP90-like ATPase n=1 Tax=Nocardia africana TaxID=134964 RepID=A0A378X3S2_9NOCA|nr:Uncharacterised protein [Nocardia africana]
MHELLNRAGLAPATAEALRQHVEATAPAKARERAGLGDVDALIEMMPLRNRIAAELGVPIADIGGAEGMRLLDPLLTEARDALAAALGYPAAGITPVIARDILGEAVGDHLTATNTEQSAGNEIDSPATVSGPASRDGQDHAQNADTRDVADGTAADIIAAASQYLATAALLDLVVQIHRRSPNSCVNNAVTGMRVLCPDNARRFEMPATRLRGHGRDVVRKVFGAGLEKAESLEQVAESLKTRPGGISVLVYKWKDTRATGSADADDHMVLLVNDSDSADEPNLVVVDLAVSRDGDTANDYGPKDLRNRRALLNKAVAFEDWRREQHKYIDRMPVEKRLFETIEFDRDGNLVAGSHMGAPAAESLPPSRQVVVPAATVDEIREISAGLPDLDVAVPVRPGAARDGANEPRRDERAPVGSRPSENAANPTPPSTRMRYTVREAGAAVGPSGREGERARTNDVGAERHRLEQLLNESYGWLDSDGVDIAVILMSELMANSLADTDGKVEVVITQTDTEAERKLRFEVLDESTFAPEIGDMPDEFAERGRGLPMMAAAADESGITVFDDGSGKSSWFELHRPLPAGGPAAPATEIPPGTGSFGEALSDGQQSRATLHRAQRGDAAAFRELRERYGEQAFRRVLDALAPGTRPSVGPQAVRLRTVAQYINGVVFRSAETRRWPVAAKEDIGTWILDLAQRAARAWSGLTPRSVESSPKRSPHRDKIAHRCSAGPSAPSFGLSKHYCRAMSRRRSTNPARCVLKHQRTI